MSLLQRLINVTFQLGAGTFAETGNNTVTLSGLRASARIVKAGTPGMARMTLDVYGMRLSLMNRLATLGMIVQLRELQRNVVTITAGDAVNGMGTAFLGTITNAWPDFDRAPNVPFRVEATTGLIEATAPATPTSHRGGVSVAVLMAGIAKQMGIGFENHGVVTMIQNPYLAGSARDQAQRLADAADIDWDIVDDTGVLTLAIWPRGSSRVSGAIPLISPSTGMIGYPSFVSQGIAVRTLYNPLIGRGQKFQLAGSQFSAANGIWTVYSLEHEIEALMPEGRWLTRIGGYAPDLPAPVTD